jgi:hypothetical protein
MVKSKRELVQRLLSGEKLNDDDVEGAMDGLSRKTDKVALMPYFTRRDMEFHVGRPITAKEWIGFIRYVYSWGDEFYRSLNEAAENVWQDFMEAEGNEETDVTDGANTSVLTNDAEKFSMMTMPSA